jgi:hypothetical protein
MPGADSVGRFFLGDVVGELVSVERQASFGFVDQVAPGGDEDVVVVSALDVSPSAVSLFQLTVDFGMRVRPHEPERPPAWANSGVTAQRARVATDLREFSVAELDRGSFQFDYQTMLLTGPPDRPLQE